jgi:hypothetical protein
VDGTIRALFEAYLDFEYPSSRPTVIRVINPITNPTDAAVAAAAIGVLETFMDEKKKTTHIASMLTAESMRNRPIALVACVFLEIASMISSLFTLVIVSS